VSEPQFFSQNGEDWYAWTILGRPRTGLVVEVGAFDGVYLSNSHGLERIGWQAICVEPHPEFIEHCRRNRPLARCIHAACVGDPASREIDFTADGLGVYSGVRVCSEDLERKYAAVGQDVRVRTVRVPAVTLGAILEGAAAPGIDFLSIDTEGNELEVLSGLDFSKHRPTVIIAEANHGPGAASLKRAMQDRGYVFLRRIGNVNYAFTCDRAVARRARHVSLRCDLEPLTHPNGIASTANRYRGRRRIRETAFRAIVQRFF